jgi:hypothetical protein
MPDLDILIWGGSSGISSEVVDAVGELHAGVGVVGEEEVAAFASS